MSAWGRKTGSEKSSFFWNTFEPTLNVVKFDLFFLVVFSFLSLYILWKWRTKAFGIFALLMCVMPLYSGVLASGTRYMMLVFPVFIFLGQALKNQYTYKALLAFWFTIQIIYFAGWANYYWIA